MQTNKIILTLNIEICYFAIDQNLEQIVSLHKYFIIKGKKKKNNFKNA